MGLKTPAQGPSCERLSVTQISASKLRLETARKLVQQDTLLLRRLASYSTHFAIVVQPQRTWGKGAGRAAHGQLSPVWDLFSEILVESL